MEKALIKMVITAALLCGLLACAGTAFAVAAEHSEKSGTEETGSVFLGTSGSETAGTTGTEEAGGAVLGTAGAADTGSSASESEDEDETEVELSFDLRKGIYCPMDLSYSNLAGLFSSEGVAILHEGGVSGHDWDVDLDGDGTRDIALCAEGSFYADDDAGVKEGKGFIIPLPEGSVTGSFTVKLKISESRSNLAEYLGGETVVLTLLFNDEKPKEEYSITVIGGYAECADSNAGFVKITKAAPGTPVLLSGDLYEGMAFSGWKSDYFVVIDGVADGIRENYDLTEGWLYMPAADVTFTAVKKEQKPYTIDLSEGFFVKEFNPPSNGTVVFDGLRQSLGWRPESLGDDYQSFDLDGDGTFDIAVAVFYSGTSTADDPSVLFYVFPLSTKSVQGDYTISGLNDTSYWPITIRFGGKTTEKEYSLTVRGGYAKDMSGQIVQRVEPGTPLQIIWDEDFDEDLVFSPEFRADKRYFGSVGENSDMGCGVKGTDFIANFIMPACDITLTFADWTEPDVTPSITPTVTPVPTEEPTPVVTEVVPSLTPTAKQEITEAIMPTDKEEQTRESDRESDDSDDEDGFNPLIILIPLAVAVAGFTVFAFWKVRKNIAEAKPSGSMSPETPSEAVPEEAAPEEAVAEESPEEEPGGSGDNRE